MEKDNDTFILKLLDESLTTSEGGDLDYNSDSFVEMFDDDSDADPDYVLSDEDSANDIDINQPGPSTSTKRKIITSTPKKQLGHKRVRLFDDIFNDDTDDETPACRPTAIAQNTWLPVDNNFNYYPYNPDNETVGINPDFIDSMTDCSPIDFYLLFLDEEVLTLLVTESNRYAKQCLKTTLSPHSRLAKWTDCTIEEMKNFICILIMMGLQPLPSLAHYWRQDDVYCSRVPDIMARNRFELLLRMFHVSDNEKVQPGDRLSKINNLVKMLNEKFKMYVEPKDKVCIDESVVPFLGRLIFRQYLKNKRHRYGVKIFKLCIEGGYTLQYKIYCGKEKEPTKDVSAKVVMELMAPYLNFGRTVYTDNWYTSVSLAKTLGEHKTHLVGTLRKNRKDIPKDVVNAKLKKEDVLAKKNKDNITVLKWKDRRDVLMLSTKHGNEMQEVNVRGGKTKNKPVATIDYNNAKSYIDYADQMGSYGTPLRRSIKWYRKIAIDLLLTTSVINALHLFKTVTGKSMKITEFKESICRELKKKTAIIRQPQQREHVLTQQNNRSKCKRCYEKNVKEGGREYAQKKTKKVYTKCLQCDDYLCKDCFYSKKHM